MIGFCEQEDRKGRRCRHGVGHSVACRFAEPQPFTDRQARALGQVCGHAGPGAFEVYAPGPEWRWLLARGLVRCRPIGMRVVAYEATRAGRAVLEAQPL